MPWHGVPGEGDDGIDIAALHHRGRLTQAEAARARRVALLEVIAPCAHALIAAARLERPSASLPVA